MVTTLSSKYQIVIPKEARKELHLEPQQKLIIKVIKGSIIIRPAKSSWNDLSGMAGDVFESLGGAKAYINEIKNSWKD
jgi:AbrB family looped-hinge helix DNA binding protein